MRLVQAWATRLENSVDLIDIEPNYCRFKMVDMVGSMFYCNFTVCNRLRSNMVHREAIFLFLFILYSCRSDAFCWCTVPDHECGSQYNMTRSLSYFFTREVIPSELDFFSSEKILCSVIYFLLSENQLKLEYVNT